MTLRSLIRKLRSCSAKPPSISQPSPTDGYILDPEDVIQYQPSADISPDPRLLQRRINEQEIRLTLIEEWISKRDKGFRRWTWK